MGDINFFTAGQINENDDSNIILSFKCGKCVVDGNKVSPDLRKGVLQLVSGDDNLLRVRWRERYTPTFEEDYIVINDAYLEKVQQCKTGRIYALRFTTRDKKLLFWMQEADEKNDSKLVADFNRHTGVQLPVHQTQSQSATQSQVTQAMDPAKMAQLRDMLSSINPAMFGQHESVSLQSVLTTEVMDSLLQDNEALEELRELMPEGYQTKEDVKEAMRCPQLAPALSGLSQAIYTDPMPLLCSMGVINPTIDPSLDPLLAFAKALEDKYKTNDSEENKST